MLVGQEQHNINRFQVTLELLNAVAASNLWSNQLHVVHVSNKQDSSSPADATTAGQQQGASRHGQHTLNPCKVVQHFLEDNDVKVTILSTCIASTTTITHYHHQSLMMIMLVVSVAVAVPLASWGTTAATRVPRLRIGERPREWTRG